MNKMNKKGQGTLEFAITVAVVVIALVVAGTFMRRAIQERFRRSADIFGKGEQYEPGKTGESVTGSVKKIKEKIDCRPFENQVAVMNQQINELCSMQDFLMKSAKDYQEALVAMEAHKILLTGTEQYQKELYDALKKLQQSIKIITQEIIKKQEAKGQVQEKLQECLAKQAL